MEEVLAGLSATVGPPPHEVPIDLSRAGHENETAWLSGPGEPVAEVREVLVPSGGGAVRVRCYRPDGRTPLPVVVYLHGGGWTFGTLDTFDAVVRALANACGAIVANVACPTATAPTGSA